MAGVLQHLRSSALNKRPNPASMVDGQMAINYASGSPCMFFKDSSGSLVKVGPVHVGSSAPNAVPASGGTAGNSLGEQWLDTSGGTYVFKIWDGGTWRSEAGEFVNTTGDTMTGALGIIAGSASTPGLFFSGDANSGLYSPGADQVAISTNGTQKIVVDANGKVGIGGNGTGNNLGVYLQNGGGASVHFYEASDGTKTMIAGADSGQDFVKIGSLSNHPIGLVTNNGEKLRITTDGKVGLGTSSVSEKFQLGGSSNQLIRIDGAGASAFIGTATDDVIQVSCNRSPFTGGRVDGTRGAAFINLNGTTTGGSINFATSTGANDGTTAVTIDSSQRVGIGVTAPQNPLVVSNAGANGFEVSSATNSGTTSYLLSYNRSTSAYTDMRFDASAFRFEVSASERARIDSSGRLLVGTSTSTNNTRLNTKIAVVNAAEGTYGGLSLTNYGGATADRAFFIDLNRSRGTADGSMTSVGSGDVLGYLIFRGADGTQFVEAATIKAEVDGIPGADDMPGRLVFSTTADGASSPMERMRIPSSGGLLLNTSSRIDDGLATIGFQGSIQKGLVLNDTDPANTRVFIAFDISGTTQIGAIANSNNTGVTYNTSSDYRLKENVIAVSDGITRLQQLKPSRFNFIAAPGHTVDGFLAHEVQEVVPEAITGEKDAVDDEGNPIYQGIDQSKLVPLLTAALQEALQKIDDLEGRLTAAGL